MALYEFKIKASNGNTVDEHQDEYPNDLHALQRALDLRNGHVIEVWQNERWVAAVGLHLPGYVAPTKSK